MQANVYHKYCNNTGSEGFSEVQHSTRNEPQRITCVNLTKDILIKFQMI